MSLDPIYDVTEVELTYRNKIKVKDRPKITSSLVAYEILRQSWDMNKIDLQEQFKIILTNRAAHCLGIVTIATGSMSACLVDPKLIFAAALKARANNIILAHNHPSGNLKVSKEDEALTQKICAGGRLLEIDVLDHIIITSEGYLSFADEGSSTLLIQTNPSLKRK